MKIGQELGAIEPETVVTERIRAGFRDISVRLDMK